MALNIEQNIVVLVGGVGGAKLALGLQQILPPERLTVIINTGDDLWYYGLRICPDIDTVLYTLSERVNQQMGWGVADDTTTALETLREYGEDMWFRVGDKDIATHLLRTQMLRDGQRLTDIIAHLAQAMGVQPRILPMTDTPVATMVTTEEHGELEFQEYFVRHRWQPTVRSLRYAGIDNATITPEIRHALNHADVILFGPSNPWLSIAPILAVPGMKAALTTQNVPRIGVTPIIEGNAVKGPAAKLMHELGYEVSASTVARYYNDVLTGFVYDERDTVFESHGLNTAAFDTMMVTHEDKAAFAEQLLVWANQQEEI